jgi:hypothetical protein
MFDALEVEVKVTVLRRLAFMCGEASADRYEAKEAIAQCGLASHFHPLWRPGRPLLGAHPGFAHTKRGRRILAEPDSQELGRQYRYLMRLFMMADKARRLYCGQNCGHWWHNLRSL